MVGWTSSPGELKGSPTQLSSSGRERLFSSGWITGQTMDNCSGGLSFEEFLIEDLESTLNRRFGGDERVGGLGVSPTMDASGGRDVVDFRETKSFVRCSRLSIQNCNRFSFWVAKGRLFRTVGPTILSDDGPTQDLTGCKRTESPTSSL